MVEAPDETRGLALTSTLTGVANAVADMAASPPGRAVGRD
jgi:hypothetical protein